MDKKWSITMKSKKANKFLEQHIFYDLENLNDGFDSESIKYFNKKDFEKILDRAEYFKLEIFGIEPWDNKCFSGVKIYEDYEMKSSDPQWYRKAFEEFLELGIQNYFSASYGVPEELLKIF